MSTRPEQPRVAIIDATLTGTTSATGSLKANLLHDWGEDKLLHIYRGYRGLLAAKAKTPYARVTPFTRQRILSLLTRYAPECVLYRPVPDNPRLHRFAMDYLRQNAVPLVVWIMDDWPEHLRYQEHPELQAWQDDLQWLLARASVRLCISQVMADAYADRYGTTFEPLANGVDPEEWPEKRTPGAGNPFIVRYAGSLANNMTLDSVLRVAEAIELLADQGRSIRFQINTQPTWERRAGERFQQFRSCQMTTHPFSTSAYRTFLREADALLIAYNFDERSDSYVSLSLANKLPECLIAGPPLLVHGPTRIATVSYVAEHLPGAVVSTPQADAVAAWLSGMMDSEQARHTLAQDCRTLALSEFSLAERRHKLRELLAGAAREPYRNYLRYCQQEEQTTLDESLLVSTLTGDDCGSAFVMLDVGAHRGSSMRPFLERGWSILAFEPDDTNRRHLEERLAGRTGVRIDSRAISDKSEEDKPFYQSDVSDGISGILAFHESHREAGKVAVTTVTEAMRDYGLDHIDFLKVDVEGLDFSVLKGVPWETVTPRFVLCEFEDAKTMQLGHDWRDMADYLQDKGYAVYVSEWYPIQRYGVRHQWRSLRKYPCELTDPAAWGNLLAIHGEVSPDRLSQALRTTMVSHRFAAQEQMIRQVIAFVPGSARVLTFARRILRNFGFGR